MCLILFAWQAHPRYPLVVAANRDEFHGRATAPADFWPERPGMLAGRDLQAGGSWLGVTRSGRFAAVTNFREPLVPETSLQRSRGELVPDFLAAEQSPRSHARAVQAAGDDYRGFNLLFGTPRSLMHVSNRRWGAHAVGPGCHGLSNYLLDTDWPKVRSGRERLQGLLQRDRVQADALLELLAERSTTPGEAPLDLGDEAVRRQLMNHFFILSPGYGTRSSTVVLIDAAGRLEFVERRFAPDGSETGTSRFMIEIGDEGS